MAETADEEEANLREATGLQIEIKLAEQKQEGETGETTEEEVAVALLADLQQQQDQEQEFLLQDLASKVSALPLQCSQAKTFPSNLIFPTKYLCLTQPPPLMSSRNAFWKRTLASCDYNKCAYAGDK